MRVYDMEEYLFGKLEGKLILLIMDINGGFSGDKPYMQGYSILDGITNEEKILYFRLYKRLGKYWFGYKYDSSWTSTCYTL